MAISLLPPLVQNQIAAGEVVERPMSIVKEVLENALDSGADHIHIELEEGGLSSILIRDNGSGMSAEDAALAPVRYATSKISTAEDLGHIHTFGFRGEALASIASVSKMTIKTKREEDLAGTEIYCEGETVQSSQSAGLPDGTSILVEDLFFNTPVRRKYMKTPATEWQHCHRHIMDIALAHPHIGFVLEHNQKRILTLSPEPTEQRIKNILGENFLQSTVPLSFDFSECVVKGWIATPSSAGTKKKHQHLFINNRSVSNPVIAKAISESYRRLVPRGAAPHYVLFLHIPPELVDVNVHPRKLEVRFIDPGRIFKLMQGAITQAFEQNNMKPELLATEEGLQRNFASSTQSKAANQQQEYTAPKTTNDSFPLHHPQTVNRNPSRQTRPTPFNPSSRATSPYAASKSVSTAQALAFTKEMLDVEAEAFRWKVLGQVQRCYILVEKEGGLLLVDQHAAHERITYERLKASEAGKEEYAQPLLTPLPLELSPMEQSFVLEHMGDFTELGFELQDIGDGTFALAAVPAVLSHGKVDPLQVFEGVIHDFDGLCTGCQNHSTELSTYKEKLRAYTACRSSVKFGDILGMREMEQLIEDYEQSPNRHTCPHGRTSSVELSLGELKKFFDR